MKPVPVALCCLSRFGLHSFLGDTAISLVRALQTVDDSWDYHIPLAGDDSEIDVYSYKLKGWIIDDRHDLGIDERDPFRH